MLFFSLHFLILFIVIYNPDLSNPVSHMGESPFYANMKVIFYDNKMSTLFPFIFLHIFMTYYVCHGITFIVRDWIEMGK